MRMTLRQAGLYAAVAVLAACPLAPRESRAQVVLDDFESYADEAALDAAWVPIQPEQAVTVPASLATDVAHTGTQSMRIDYKLNTNPYFGQDAYFFASQDWSSYNRLKFWYLGRSNNSNEKLNVRFLNSFGVTVGSVLTIDAATKADVWTEGTLNLTGLRNDITSVRVGLAPTNYGTGIVWIDDITLVPEPSSLALLCFGAIGCAWRRRVRSA